MGRKGKTTGSESAAEPFSDYPRRSSRGIWWIIGGLLVAGALGWAKWLRSLPKQAAEE
jgi:hypothetical protein